MLQAGDSAINFGAFYLDEGVLSLPPVEIKEEKGYQTMKGWKSGHSIFIYKAMLRGERIFAHILFYRWLVFLARVPRVEYDTVLTCATVHIYRLSALWIRGKTTKSWDRLTAWHKSESETQVCHSLLGVSQTTACGMYVTD